VVCRSVGIPAAVVAPVGVVGLGLAVAGRSVGLVVFGVLDLGWVLELGPRRWPRRRLLLGGPVRRPVWLERGLVGPVRWVGLWVPVAVRMMRTPSMSGSSSSKPMRRRLSVVMC
jgi:hypothetical protein